MVAGASHESAVEGFSEASRFFLAATVFLIVTGILLYLGLAASYPPIHDAMHSVRHALAIVPCH